MSPIANTYFQRYAINHIELQMQPGVVDSADLVCNLLLKSAKLLASSLLDGLYDGSIILKT